MGNFEARVAAAKRAIRDRSTEGVQRRSFSLEGLQVRDATGGGYSIVGHGAVFHSMSEDLGGFREVIVPGAFSKVLRGTPDVRALYNHDPNLVLARTANGSLSLSEDATGLYYKADVSSAIAGTYYGQAMRAQLSEGLVTQSSFAFRLASGGDTWEDDPDTGLLLRTIHEFRAVYDVSPVTYPAYGAADSGLAGRRGMDTEDISVLAQMIALGAQYLEDEEDPADATIMEGVIKNLTGLLSSEETEAASFAGTGGSARPTLPLSGGARRPSGSSGRNDEYPRRKALERSIEAYSKLLG